MKTVSRDEYVAFVRSISNSSTECCEEPHSTTSAAFTYDSNGVLKAKAVYSRPVQMAGVKTIVTYYIAE